MEELSKIYLDKKIDYNEIISKSFIKIKKFNYNIDLTIVIPLFGRSEQIQPLIDHLKTAMFYHNKLKYRIIFIEQDTYKKNMDIILSNNCDYVFIEKNIEERFNKCLCMNVGALLCKSKYYVFHDVDLVVGKLFFRNIFKNIKIRKNDNVIHCLSNRQVIYLDGEKSSLVREKKINIDNILNIAPYDDKNTTGVMYGIYGAPGGSIFLKSDFFFKIGGYDDSFFSGYSPEDAFFWNKIESLEKIYGCDNPENKIFHLDHEHLAYTKMQEHQELITNFINLDNSYKLEYMKLKSENLKYDKK
jgi:predicted glycosyltransferase involved in capsule biosynthesis